MRAAQSSVVWWVRAALVVSHVAALMRVFYGMCADHLHVIVLQAAWICAGSCIHAHAHRSARHCCIRRDRGHADCHTDHASRAVFGQRGAGPSAFQPIWCQSGVARGSRTCSAGSISARNAQQRAAGLHPICTQFPRPSHCSSGLQRLHFAARIYSDSRCYLFAGCILVISEWRFLHAAAIDRCQLAFAVFPRPSTPSFTVPAALIPAIAAVFPALSCALVAGDSFRVVL
jgi:hypothetical protein